jgi:hypothetical protein
MFKYITSITATSLLLAQLSTAEPQFLQLKNQLETYGFQVLIQPTPVAGTYGLIEEKTRQIWIHPIVFELHVANPTLIHEAVHAAQICAGNGRATPLGLEIQPSNYSRRFYQRYQDFQRQDLEREAYTVQTQENRFQLVQSLLEKYCS